MTVDARCPVSDVAAVLQAGRQSKRWVETPKAAVFHDLGRVEGRIADLRAAFPPDTLHAVAIKANPTVELLKVVVASGAGLEAASWEEVMLAQAAGCPAERIVFDSPAKTDAELEEAMGLGVWVNADHADELLRMERLGAPGAARIGLRVNPGVGEGSIAATSTVGRHSRFGVPLADAEGLLRRFPFVSGLHVHTGSQGCGLELLTSAVRSTAEVAADLGVAWLDIGGGLPVRYLDADPDPPSFRAWAARLEGMPGWGQRRLVTELGRAIQAGAGWAISRIEAVKEVGGQPMLVVHLGADFLLRRVYRPDDWDHEFVVLDPQGHPKSGPRVESQIAGPLCFAGDLLARRRPLAPAEPGDLLLIRDCGAYAVGMWSRHCSRGLPPAWGYRDSALTLLHAGESPTEVVDFWSLRPER